MRGAIALGAVCAVLALPVMAALAVHGYDSGSLALRTTAHELRLLVWASLFGGLLLVGVVVTGWAAREVIRAWRTAEHIPPERHVYRERIIDGRAPAQSIYLEQPPALWPEQVRAQWGGMASRQLPPGHMLQLEGGAEGDESAGTAFDAFLPAEHWH